MRAIAQWQKTSVCRSKRITAMHAMHHCDGTKLYFAYNVTYMYTLLRLKPNLPEPHHPTLHPSARARRAITFLQHLADSAKQILLQPHFMITQGVILKKVNAQTLRTCRWENKEGRGVGGVGGSMDRGSSCGSLVFVPRPVGHAGVL